MSTDDYSPPDDVSELPEFDNDIYQILDDDGTVLSGATVPELSDDELVDMYCDLKRARLFDEKMMNLAYRGEIENYAPMAGHEAAQISSRYAIRTDDQDPDLLSDLEAPTYREEGAMMQRLGMDNLLTELHGRPGGNTDEDAEMLPTAIPIATQIPHAVGWSWAAKLKGDDRIALAYLGDGATSEGDFHEGLNFAGVYDTPTVFLCQNNQYAISTSVDRQTAADTIAQKAVAYGFEGIHVDGMDPLAVYDATRAAAEKARTEEETALEDHLPVTDTMDYGFLHNQGVAARPTLIEADLYRFGPHTTSDDPSMYRRQEEEGEWNEKDPVPRMEQFLYDQGLIDDEMVDAIEQAAEEEIAGALETVQARPEPGPESMFDQVYDEMTPRLEEQYREHFEDQPHE